MSQNIVEAEPCLPRSDACERHFAFYQVFNGEPLNSRQTETEQRAPKQQIAGQQVADPSGTITKIQAETEAKTTAEDANIEAEAEAEAASEAEAEADAKADAKAEATT